MPLYAKAHSYGEYVFDWAWADAYRRYGRRYYPKLVAAIPFTPAPGPRLFATDDAVRAALIARGAGSAAAARTATAIRRSRRCTSCFPTEAEARACEAAGMIVRNGVQFRWENPGFRDFADFLATFNHDKRKKVKQERRKRRRRRRRVHAQGRRRDHVRRLVVLPPLLRAHLSRPPFDAVSRRWNSSERIGAELPGNVMLALGRRDGTPICAALDIFDADTLWGRYWGTTEYVPGLHFEACYYQAIDFCIERRIARFEGGAQGVHKLARGLVPVTTWSAHAIADRRVRARDRRVLRAGTRGRRARRSTSSTRRVRSRQRAANGDR